MQLEGELGRKVNEDELLLYLNHPSDTVALLGFQDQFGDGNCLPLSVWLEGLAVGEEFSFSDSNGKLHHLSLVEFGSVDQNGVVQVSFQLNHEFMRYQIQLEPSRVVGDEGRLQADPTNPNHVAALSNGDLWVVHVREGDIVKKGEELCNISIMKQEKGIFAARDAVVKKVYIQADFQNEGTMASVQEGDLILELDDVSRRCPGCEKLLPTNLNGARFCAYCGSDLGDLGQTDLSAENGRQSE